MGIFSRENWHSGLTYKQTCDQCKETFKYTDYQLGFRPWFADGFVYCPRCKKPLRHNEKFAIKVEKNDKQDIIVEEKKYERENKKDQKQTISVNDDKENMMYCQHCGERIPKNSKFCSNCGNDVSGEKLSERTLKKESVLDNVIIQTQEQKTDNRKEKYFGEVRKCPACGELLGAYAVRCSSCNYEVLGQKNSNYFSELIEKLNELENEKKGKKKNEINVINKQIYNLIEGYQVPYSKEELFEFILLSKNKKKSQISSNNDTEEEHYSNLRNVWKIKYKQLYEKAEFLYGNDPDFELIREKRLSPKKKKSIIAIIFGSIGFAIILALSIIILCVNLTRRIESDSLFLGEYLPCAESLRGRVSTNSPDLLIIRDVRFSSKEYIQYIKLCKDAGYTVDIMQDSSSYGAYSSLGYKIELNYYSLSKDMSIEISAPIKMTNIIWPTSEIASTLPQPNSLYGKIISNTSSRFTVYIGNMTIDDFNDYISLVITAGYNVNYRRDDYYYYADNAEGNDLTIEYEGNNIVYINIYEW